MCIKWVNLHHYSFFTVSNGIRQGGTLSPRLFAVYIDGQSKHLHDARSGYFKGHQYINHVMYADDICFLSSKCIAIRVTKTFRNVLWF